MSNFTCTHCRASLRRVFSHQHRSFTISSHPWQNKPSISGQPSSSSVPFNSSAPTSSAKLDISGLLSTPTWSVRSLLPSSSAPPIEEISPAQLSHLLRLSALPQPTSPEEEASMLSTLHSQLHFVRDIQSVDTEGIEPLQRIADESEEGTKQATIGIEALKEALGMEQRKGRVRRPRRKRNEVEVLDGGEGAKARKSVEGWDVFKPAGQVVNVPGAGKFFVVKSGKESEKD